MTDIAASRSAKAGAIQHRLSEGLGKIDPHHRLVGRPVAYRIVDGTTLEITYRDVPGIAEAEVLGVKRLIGAECFCTVAPQTAETVTVRFIVPLEAGDAGQRGTAAADGRHAHPVRPVRHHRKAL